ncbi:unnamed protein product [Pleuronectes platessa]|uniref:Uncharacterized protein n=1 Tax=Pleuronectes platessa TaxID=8262 RepID=A0A9N7Z943_PLEPL|nr:unnamed protein product [Pleuronectes platessa]
MLCIDRRASPAGAESTDEALLNLALMPTRPCKALPGHYKLSAERLPGAGDNTIVKSLWATAAACSLLRRARGDGSAATGTVSRTGAFVVGVGVLLLASPIAQILVIRDSVGERMVPRQSGWTRNHFLDLFRASICLCGGERRTGRLVRNDTQRRRLGCVSTATAGMLWKPSPGIKKETESSLPTPNTAVETKRYRHKHQINFTQRLSTL